MEGAQTKDPLLAKKGGEEEGGYGATPNAFVDDPEVQVCCLCCCPRYEEGDDLDLQPFPDSRPCTDAFFAVLWLVNVGAFLYMFSQVVAERGLTDLRDKFWKTIPDIAPTTRSHAWSIFVICASTTLGCVGLAYLLLTYATRAFVRWTLISAVTMFVCVAFANLFTIPSAGLDGLVLFLVYLLFAFLIFVFVYTFRSKLPLTVLLLEHSVRALWAFGGVAAFAIGAIVVHTLWIGACLLVYIHIIDTYDLLGVNLFREDDEVYVPPEVSAMLVLLLFQYFWTAQMIMYTLHFIASSTVANWYFYSAEDPALRKEYARGRWRRRWPSLSAFRYAMFHNMGTLALCSFLLAAVRTLREVLRAIFKDDPSIADRIVDWLLACLEGALAFQGHYVIAYSAIYGVSFRQGAKALDRLLSGKHKDENGNRRALGLQTIYNDDITSILSIVSAFSIASFVSVCTYAYAANVYDVPKYKYAGGGSFLFSLFASCTALTLLGSGVSAMFICFAEDEDRLKTNHPTLHAQINSVAQGSRVPFTVFWCIPIGV